jgi:hypothetical protein
MKKIMLVGLCLIGLLGCKGKNGRDGSNATPFKQSVILTGSITSDDFTIYNGDIGKATQVSVYLNAGNQAMELPYFLPGYGVNTFYVATPTSVRFRNCALAGGTNYIISLTFI